MPPNRSIEVASDNVVKYTAVSSGRLIKRGFAGVADGFRSYRLRISAAITPQNGMAKRSMSVFTSNRRGIDHLLDNITCSITSPRWRSAGDARWTSLSNRTHRTQSGARREYVINSDNRESTCVDCAGSKCRDPQWLVASLLPGWPTTRVRFPHTNLIKRCSDGASRYRMLVCKLL